LESYIVATGIKDAGMGKTVFVPLTDDLLYEHPERILGPVIPFSQQARLTTVKAAFSMATSGLASKAKLETSAVNSTIRSNRYKTSLPHGGAAR
jgi:hypothetical protein